MNTSRKGFTLIEMLIVVAIIGILASIVVVGLGPAQRRGRDSRRAADLREVQSALELFYNKFGHYPGGTVTTEDTSCLTAPSGWSTLSTCLTSGTTGIGVSTVPNDPTSSKIYEYASDGNSYVLHATLDDTGSNLLKSSLTDAIKPSFVTAFKCYTGQASNADYCLSL